MKKIVRFIKDDKGMEALQWAIVVVIAIAVGTFIISRSGAVKKYVSDAAKGIDKVWMATE